MTFLNLPRNPFFYTFFYNFFFFFSYIKMPEYYQENKERLQMKACARYQNLS